MMRPAKYDGDRVTPISLSLPSRAIKKLEERSKALGISRGEYVNNLIMADGDDGTKNDDEAIKRLKKEFYGTVQVYEETYRAVNKFDGKNSPAYRTEIEQTRDLAKRFGMTNREYGHIKQKCEDHYHARYPKGLSLQNKLYLDAVCGVFQTIIFSNKFGNNDTDIFREMIDVMPKLDEWNDFVRATDERFVLFIENLKEVGFNFSWLPQDDRERIERIEKAEDNTDNNS